MSENDPGLVTRLLRAAARGEPEAAAELLPRVYDELRSLARARMARLPPGQTLQATALVHEAYLRVVGDADPAWEGRRHFFGAAARAMRQILVDQARRKGALKRGGDRRRVEAVQLAAPLETPAADMLALDEALSRLEVEAPRPHRVVMLRFFAGLTIPEVAEIVGVTTRTVETDWRYARAWLHAELRAGDGKDP